MRIESILVSIILSLAAWPSTSTSMPTKSRATHEMTGAREPRNKYPCSYLNYNKHPSSNSGNYSPYQAGTSATALSSYHDPRVSLLTNNDQQQLLECIRQHSLPCFNSLSDFQEKILKNNGPTRVDVGSNSVQTPRKPTLSSQLPGSSCVSDFRPGRFVVDFYQPLCHSAGYVQGYQGFSENNEPIAVKVIDVEKMAKQHHITEKRAVCMNILAETELCQKLKHPNIFQCSTPKFDHNADFAFIAVEYCRGHYLRRKIATQNLSKNEAQCNFWQLLNGLDYMHSMHVAHRNLNPETLFITNSGLLKIGDLGLATRLPLDPPEANMNERPETSRYVAPEMLITMGAYDPFAADIYAAALTFIENRTFQFPLLVDGYDLWGDSFRVFLQSLFINSSQERFSNEEIYVLAQMLQFDPSKRISARDLMQLPWIQNLKNQCSVSI